MALDRYTHKGTPGGLRATTQMPVGGQAGGPSAEKMPDRVKDEHLPLMMGNPASCQG